MIMTFKSLVFWNGQALEKRITLFPEITAFVCRAFCKDVPWS